MKHISIMKPPRKKAHFISIVDKIDKERLELVKYGSPKRIKDVVNQSQHLIVDEDDLVELISCATRICNRRQKIWKAWTMLVDKLGEDEKQDVEFFVGVLKKNGVWF